MIRFHECAFGLNGADQLCFQPLQFHREPANLRKEPGLPGGLRLVIAHVLLAKYTAPTVEHLLVRLRDRGRMDRICAGELAERLLLFQRIECNPERDVGAAPLAFLRQSPATCDVKILTDLYIACGPVSGTNHIESDERDRCKRRQILRKDACGRACCTRRASAARKGVVWWPL